MTLPNPQDPNSPLYAFIDTQPASAYPATPDSSLSNITTRQFVPDNITNSLPAVVTKTSHGMNNGDTIRATKFISFPFALATGMQQLNNLQFYVQQATTDTFILADSQSVPIDARSFTPYISGGQFTNTTSFLVVNPSNFPPPGIIFPTF